MQIRARMSMSADGYVTTPSGGPALTADPAFVSGQSHGILEFLEGCEAALMGRTTFEPALTNERWPWPTLNVFVLASQRPAGTPDHVVTDSDPERLLEKLREANRGGDVHLVGGPRTIATLPRARSARPARARRAAAALRSGDATDVVAQSADGSDVRARTRASRRLGGDRLCPGWARGRLAESRRGLGSGIAAFLELSATGGAVAAPSRRSPPCNDLRERPGWRNPPAFE